MDDDQLKELLRHSQNQAKTEAFRQIPSLALMGLSAGALYGAITGLNRYSQAISMKTPTLHLSAQPRIYVTGRPDKNRAKQAEGPLNTPTKFTEAPGRYLTERIGGNLGMYAPGGTERSDLAGWFWGDGARSWVDMPSFYPAALTALIGGVGLGAYGANRLTKGLIKHERNRRLQEAESEFDRELKRSIRLGPRIKQANVAVLNEAADVPIDQILQRVENIQSGTEKSALGIGTALGMLLGLNAVTALGSGYIAYKGTKKDQDIEDDLKRVMRLRARQLYPDLPPNLAVPTNTPL